MKRNALEDYLCFCVLPLVITSVYVRRFFSNRIVPAPILPSFAEVDRLHANRTTENSLASAVETLDYLWAEWRRRRIPLWLFVGLCLNVAIAPTVYAAADGTLERGNAYALGLLGLLTLGLSIYLFVVIFQPERF